MSAVFSTERYLPERSSSSEEGERLAQLASYGILDTEAEADYDRIARIAADCFDAPIALVSFVARDRQWFKARIGLDAAETSRNVSFCAHAIGQDGIMVVPDATRDERFALNPLVTGAPEIRFYAGAPLTVSSGHRLGTLCVIDSRPRPPLSPVEEKLLESMATLVTDHLERRRLDITLRNGATLAQVTSTALVCLDRTGAISFWNPAAERLFDYSAASALGRSFDLIVPERCRAAYESELARLVSGTAPNALQEPIQIEMRDRTGREFPVEIALACWNDGSGTSIGGIIRDISERRRTEERLYQLAHYDELTRLPNRTLFQERMEVAARETGALSLMLIDIDRFKDVNDTLGHPAGDRLLVAIAERLRACLEPDDLVARIAGDEYAVMLPGCGDPSRASDKAEQVLACFAEPFTVDDHVIPVGTSIGVALWPGLCDSPSELLTSADIALHQAKAQAGGRYQFFYPGLRQQITARRSLESEIRRAFAEHEFELFYQPQIRLADGALVGAEALLRWRHPKRGLLAPGAFLPVLDACALAAQVGDWTIRRACRDAAALRDAAGRPIRIGVNLFAAQFRAGNLVETVQGALADAGLAPECLELEITENIILRQDDDMIGPLSDLRFRGVGVAFDDYGTGYASLSLLKRYPLTRLKIDREFVRDVVADPDDAAIVRAVLALGRSLGLDIIAEGIESAAQEDFLLRHGCHEGQGYLYGRPMPAGDLRALIETGITGLAGPDAERRRAAASGP